MKRTLLSRDLLFREVYPQPIETVWEAITDSRAIAEWLMANDFKPVLGHEFQFRSRPMGSWSGIVDCRVTQLDPPRRLSYTWDSDQIKTLLSFELSPVEGGTQLILRHTGFSGFKAVLVSLMMGGGWKGIVKRGIGNVAAKLARGEALTGEPGCAKRG
jgi:uncharacterized protein YndB with AHSA1/START domain